jgi:bacterial/archaeal transporter family-2 protein
MPIALSVAGFLLAVTAGLSFVFQQAVNANLRGEIASVWWAGFVSYLGGALVMILLSLLLREPFPSGELLRKTQWLSWTGGIFGAAYIAISILLLPRLGAATLIALIVAGQMMGSLAFDHFGLLGVPVHPANSLRLMGAALLILGVVLVRV